MPFHISITNMVFMQHYWVGIEEYEIDQKVMYISIQYSKLMEVKKDSVIDIWFDLIYV